MSYTISEKGRAKAKDEKSCEGSSCSPKTRCDKVIFAFFSFVLLSRIRSDSLLAVEFFEMCKNLPREDAISLVGDSIAGIRRESYARGQRGNLGTKNQVVLPVFMAASE